MKKSIVAQLLFAVDSKVDFGRITSELEGVLSCQRDYVVKAASETANIVVFSMTECRVLLSLSQVSGNGFGSCLCVSVGPSDRSESDQEDEQLELLCSRLVERIQNRYGSVAVVWRHVLGTVNAELVNALNERLPGISPFLLPIKSLIDSIAISDLTKVAMLDEKATSFKSKERINRFIPTYQPIIAEPLDCHWVRKDIACGRCNSRQGYSPNLQPAIRHFAALGLSVRLRMFPTCQSRRRQRAPICPSGVDQVRR